METSKEKENIQNTLKVLQEKSQHIEKLLEKGNDVIIFQVGSHSIKYGFANQMLPQSVKTTLGYYHANPPAKQTLDLSLLDEVEPFLPELEDSLRKKGNLKSDAKQSAASKLKQKSRIEISPSLSQAKFEKLDPKKIYFEDDIYVHQNNPNFVIREPIKYGLFNLSKSYNFDAILGDIEQLIRYILEKKLELSQLEFSKYSIILIVPDVFHRGQVKGIINIFMKKLAFARIYLHQESALAAFGTCLSQACVVDIGSDKINICCIDEGVVLPQTIIRKFYGGKEVDLFLHKLLTKKNSYSYMSKNVKLDVTIPGDLNQIESVKQLGSSYQHLEDSGNIIYEGALLRNQSEVLLISHGDPFVIAPHIFFYSNLLNSIKQRDPDNEDYFNFQSDYFDSYFDPEDYYDEPGQSVAYGPLLLTQQMELEKQDENQEKPTNEFGKRKLTLDDVHDVMDPFKMQDLDDLICFSISQVAELEVRKKMANFILISGGGCQVLNTVEEFEDRLINTFSLYDTNIDRVEVINPISRDVPQNAVSWVGGTVIQRLDSMKELWISRAKWLGDVERDDDDENTDRRIKKDRGSESCGVKLLREKLPFLW